MSALYHWFSHNVLFRYDAESLHDLLFSALRLIDGRSCARLIKPLFAFDDPALKINVFGLDFPNPVGLAAGFDKNAQAANCLAALGFGALELGTITAQPQPGNERPRIFRLLEDRALINRMGFPSQGVDRVAARLEQSARLPQDCVLGVNIGKSKAVALEWAAQDYLNSFRKLKGLANYFVINVSSPNTPELRKLQGPEYLDQLLAAVQLENHLGQPLLVKVAPDLSFDELDKVIEVALHRKISALICSNTTLARDGLRGHGVESGGLSGAPLKSKALAQVRHVYRRCGGRLPIVGVGGIFNAQDAYDFFCAGASLIQIYSALIYEGPWLIRNIKIGLSQILRERGLASIHEIVGKENR